MHVYLFLRGSTGLAFIFYKVVSRPGCDKDYQASYLEDQEPIFGAPELVGSAERKLLTTFLSRYVCAHDRGQKSSYIAL